MDKKLIAVLIVILLAICGYFFATNVVSQSDNAQINIDEGSLENQENVILTDNNTTLEKKLYSTNKSDTNVILVENNSTADISNSILNKSGNSSQNGDSVDFYGTNSALLVKKQSTANVNNVKIITNSTGSNAIFVTNAESDNQNTNQEGGGSPNAQSMDNQAGDGQQPPEMPEQSGDGQQPSGNSNQSGDGQQPPSMNNQSEQSQGAPENSNQQESPSTNSEDYSEGGATANVENVQIETYQDKSRGLDATYGGKINATNVQINTRGGSCAALATDRGEGSVTVSNSQLNTGVDNSSGKGSPCIYSTGNISVTKCEGTAYNSQIACIEGKNNIIMDDCNFNCYATGNREDNGEYVDLGGIFIYQSMSGDADVGTATLNATNSKLNIAKESQYYDKAPMLHITNTNAIINLKNTDMEFGSNILLNVSGQSQWGNQGSNGGNLEFTCEEEDLNGNIFIDSISSLNFTMKNTKYNGAINPDEDCGNTTISIDSQSTWTLTGNSHITAIKNSGQIEYGDYTLYVNGTAYTKDNPYKA